MELTPSLQEYFKSISGQSFNFVVDTAVNLGIIPIRIHEQGIDRKAPTKYDMLDTQTNQAAIYLDQLINLSSLTTDDMDRSAEHNRNTQGLPDYQGDTIYFFKPTKLKREVARLASHCVSFELKYHNILIADIPMDIYKGKMV